MKISFRGDMKKDTIFMTKTTFPGLRCIIQMHYLNPCLLPVILCRRQTVVKRLQSTVLFQAPLRLVPLLLCKLLYAIYDTMQWPHDSNLTLEVLSRIMHCLKEKLPPTLYLQLDNCGRGKQVQMFFFLSAGSQRYRPTHTHTCIRQSTTQLKS